MQFLKTLWKGRLFAWLLLVEAKLLASEPLLQEFVTEVVNEKVREIRSERGVPDNDG